MVGVRVGGERVAVKQLHRDCALVEPPLRAQPVHHLEPLLLRDHQRGATFIVQGRQHRIRLGMLKQPTHCRFLVTADGQVQRGRTVLVLRERRQAKLAQQRHTCE